MPQMVYFYVIKPYVQVCEVLKGHMLLYKHVVVLLKLSYTCVFKPLSMLELAMFV